MQSRDNLQVLRLVGEFPIFGYSHVLIAALLLSLAHFYPLLCCKMLAYLGKGILVQTETVEYWAVANWIENYVVIGTVYIISYVPI